MEIKNVVLPHISFEQRDIEDRELTMASPDGMPKYKTVDYVVIRAPGSKDTVERVADEWLSSIKKASREQALNCYPMEAVQKIESGYKEWKETQVMPEFGTPIRMCLMYTPAEQKNILGAGVVTLEQMADANEMTMGAIPNGREMKRRAQLAIDKASESKTAQTIDALQSEIEALKALLTDKGVEIPEPKKRGRPPKAA